MATKTITRQFGEKQPKSNDVEPEFRAEMPGVIDHKVALLAVAGAAASADCDPCLDRIVPELEGAGITKADIRSAVESGKFLGAYPENAVKIFERECRDDRKDQVEKNKGNRS